MTGSSFQDQKQATGILVDHIGNDPTDFDVQNVLDGAALSVIRRLWEHDHFRDYDVKPLLRESNDDDEVSRHELP